MKSVLLSALTAVGVLSSNIGILAGSDGSISVDVSAVKPTVEKLLLDERREPLEKYSMLRNLQNIDESLFHSVLLSNPTKYLPLIYTPTVGAACLAFSQLTPVNSGGIYITPEDSKNIPEILRQWVNPDQVKMVVITDGSRILGLGDLGGDGMGIPLGKAALYVAAGGFAPSEVVPITLDLGSNVRGEDRQKFPSYLGTPSVRSLDEGLVMNHVRSLVNGIKEVYPNAVIQWEDFHLTRAFAILEEFRNEVSSFNDDIQGTAAVVLGGMMAAVKVQAISEAEKANRQDIVEMILSDPNNYKLSNQVYLFVGAGSAALGVAELLVSGMSQLEGIDEHAARQLIFMMDSQGLVVSSRKGGITDPIKKKFARSNGAEGLTSIREVILKYRPSVLVGLAAQGPIFTKEVLSAMAEINTRPIIFSLSNPTSKAECTAQDVYDHTQGRGIFASGSPFPTPTPRPSYPPPPSVTSQCNNMFIFPGVGLGASIGKLSNIPDEAFISAALALSAQLTVEDLRKGMLFPSLNTLRVTSRAVAIEVIKFGIANGISPLASVADSQSYVDRQIENEFKDAIWMPNKNVRLPGSHVNHAVEYLISKVTEDRSFATTKPTLTYPLSIKDYSFAPWLVRYPPSIYPSAAINAKAILHPSLQQQQSEWSFSSLLYLWVQRAVAFALIAAAFNLGMNKLRAMREQRGYAAATNDGGVSSDTVV